MDKEILSTIAQSEYGDAYSGLERLLKINRISNKDLDIILHTGNKLLIGEFLELYDAFTESNLKLIESFINANLLHENRLFVSDLIEFASEWGLRINYDLLIGFLSVYKGDETYVQLASIDYVYRYMNLTKLDEIYNALYSILQNPRCNQSSQVKASFVLLRITNNEVFLEDLIDLLINGCKENRELMKNMLSQHFNGPKYFKYYNLLFLLANDKS